jgi:hypothetical protein
MTDLLAGTVPAWKGLGSIQYVCPDAGCNESFTLQKMWMEDCLNNHKKCHRTIQMQMPRRIVHVGLDNTSLRLIETQGIEVPYAALSHCWGGEQPLITTLSTIHSRKESLEWDSMPATFQDAIKVIRKLGIYYLWLDSLCIVQDDSADWEFEAVRMADIYEGAQLVIAASSSPNHGASFLAPRKTPLGKSIELNLNYENPKGDIFKVMALHQGLEYPFVEPLDERAWTFQEQRLARRLIQFHRQALKWSCTEGTAYYKYQDKIFSASGRLDKSFFGGDISPQVHLRSWYQMVDDYTDRKLTRLSDRLPALSGIAARVSEKTGSDYIAGLWKDSLFFDLQWSTVTYMLTTKYELLRTSTTYLAPTFCWISIPGQSTYRPDNQIAPFPSSRNMVVDTKVCDVQIT